MNRAERTDEAIYSTVFCARLFLQYSILVLGGGWCGYITSHKSRTAKSVAAAAQRLCFCTRMRDIPKESRASSSSNFRLIISFALLCAPGCTYLVERETTGNTIAQDAARLYGWMDQKGGSRDYHDRRFERTERSVVLPRSGNVENIVRV